MNSKTMLTTDQECMRIRLLSWVLANSGGGYYNMEGTSLCFGPKVSKLSFKVGWSGPGSLVEALGGSNSVGWTVESSLSRGWSPRWVPAWKEPEVDPYFPYILYQDNEYTVFVHSKGGDRRNLWDMHLDRQWDKEVDSCAGREPGAIEECPVSVYWTKGGLPEWLKKKTMCNLGHVTAQPKEKTMKPTTVHLIDPWVIHAFLVLGVMKLKLPGDELIASFERKNEVIEYRYLPHLMHPKLAEEILRLRNLNEGRATFMFWAKQFNWINQAQTPKSKEQRLKQVLDTLSKLRVLRKGHGVAPLGVLFEPKFYKGQDCKSDEEKESRKQECYEFFNRVQQQVVEQGGRWRILQQHLPGCVAPLKAMEWRDTRKLSNLARKS